MEIATLGPLAELLKTLAIKHTDCVLACASGIYLITPEKLLIPLGISEWTNQHNHVAYIIFLLSVSIILVRIMGKLGGNLLQLSSNRAAEKRNERIFQSLPKDEKKRHLSFVQSLSAELELDPEDKIVRCLLNKGFLVDVGTIRIHPNTWRIFRLSPFAIKKLYPDD